MYQETAGLEPESFASFSFPQSTDDINQNLPIVDTLIQPAPPTDLRAASEWLHTLQRLIDDIAEFQKNLSMIHNLLSSERFPSPEITKAHVKELQEQFDKIREVAISSGIAALNSDTSTVNTALFMNLEGMGQTSNEDQNKINMTFQKTESMKKSANAVVSVLKKPTIRDS